MDNLLSMEHMDEEEVMRLIRRALEMKAGNYMPYQEPRYIANLFFENSTRTKTSFEMAELKMDVTSIPFDVNYSSVSKGETLYDTCKTLESLGADALVIRHSEKEYYGQLTGLGIPVINAGDGSGSHPTQSLLDLMTIYERFGTFRGLKIVIAGDIVHSRVAHSNQQALERLGADVCFSAPPEWVDHDALVPYKELDEVIGNADVIMLLRVQHERHDVAAKFTKEDYNRKYGMNLARYGLMKKDAIIMHPAPVNRGAEISEELVESEKSVIFEQMKNGVFARMSVLQEILGSVE
ncbi:aspartate carbamoyltransferase catalytic subunit [Salinicoccus carnicancri]|uniref:aspartate carbamoyltransferase catalytic subunit n=1 Tax=Salinicoccus carnicancri TaxID=558170 RepID=UPI0002EB41BD|nr:aspartate carbamoyltransferase catalytic subunit [Salinicoccus carnicancri]